MSNLVEKVARAMYPSWWETIDTCADGVNCESCPLDRAHSLGRARAAIAAVAEWLSEDPDARQCCVAALVLNEQLEQPKGAAGDGR